MLIACTMSKLWSSCRTWLWLNLFWSLFRLHFSFSFIWVPRYLNSWICSKVLSLTFTFIFLFNGFLDISIVLVFLTFISKPAWLLFSFTILTMSCSLLSVSAISAVSSAYRRLLTLCLFIHLYTYNTWIYTIQKKVSLDLFKGNSKNGQEFSSRFFKLNRNKKRIVRLLAWLLSNIEKYSKYEYKNCQ